MNGKQSAAMIGALWLAEATNAFETSMLYAAIADLIEAFGDPTIVGWLVTVYLLVGAAAAAVVARLGDLYGRQRITLILLGIAVFASLLSAVTSYFPLILLGRGLQGLTAPILPLAFGLAREHLPKKSVPIAVGWIMSAASAGIAGGLVFGGLLTDQFGWHAIFYASALFALIAWVLVRLYVPQSGPIRKSDTPLDLGSIFLLVPAIVALLLAVSNGDAFGWTSWKFLGLVLGSLVVLGFWIRRSLVHPDPLINVRLFANRGVAVANGSYALLALGGLQQTMVFSLLLQAPRETGIGLGLSSAYAGLILLPGAVIGAFIGPLAGIAMQRIGSRTVMIFGGLIASAGWLLAMFFAGSIIGALLLMLIVAIGTFLIFAAGPTVVMDNVPTDRTSEATGMLAVLRSVAMAIGAQLTVLLLATSTVTGPDGKSRFPDTHAFLLTFAAIAMCCFLAAAVAWLLPRSQPAPVSASR